MFKGKRQYASIIGRDTTFTGNLFHKGHIRVDGRVVGDIDVEKITIGEGALIEGNIRTAVAFIDGSVRGNVIARELLKIECHGDITGDIIAISLGVDEGGCIRGCVSMKMESAEVIHLTDERIQESRVRDRPAAAAEPQSREFRPAEIRLKEVRRADGSGRG